MLPQTAQDGLIARCSLRTDRHRELLFRRLDVFFRTKSLILILRLAPLSRETESRVHLLDRVT